MPRYLRPDWFTTNLANRLVGGLTRLGLSYSGGRVLSVRGRKSGEWRSVPVNLLELDGLAYLVAPRGDTQWVRNLRAAGSGELRAGGARQTFQAVELEDSIKPAILRAYLQRWGGQVGAFFDGITAAGTEDDLRRIAPDHPVFLVKL